MKKEKTGKGKKVGRILGYLLVGALFVFVAVELVYKLTKKPFYLFNTRYDVVLTDSMSKKNEKYEEFLKDTEQIQAFDFVVSKRITDKTKLNVLDVVIFNNPDVGTDMHRIVEIDRIGETFELKNLVEEKIGDVTTFKFASPDSCIALEKTYVYTDMEVVVYTREVFDENEYYFNVGASAIEPTITSTQDSNGFYRNVITYHRDSKSPAKFSIAKRNYEYNATFEYVKLSGGKNEILINNDIIKQADEDGKYIFNVSERYLIRGDKANTDDGWYERKDLQSKVTNVIPKLGYPVRFLSSPWGTIMILGLCLIPIAYWLLFEKKKPEPVEEGANPDQDLEEPEDEAQPIENQPEEQPAEEKPAEEPQAEENKPEENKPEEASNNE